MKDKNTLRYMGYEGDIHYDAKTKRFRGKVIGIKASVEYEGSTLRSLEENFKRAVDICLPEIFTGHVWA